MLDPELAGPNWDSIPERYTQITITEFSVTVAGKRKEQAPSKQIRIATTPTYHIKNYDLVGFLQATRMMSNKRKRFEQPEFGMFDLHIDSILVPSLSSRGGRRKLSGRRGICQQSSGGLWSWSNHPFEDTGVCL